MKLKAHFDRFLADIVNINQTRLDQLDEHVAALKHILKSSPGVGSLVKDAIPQGSWAHRTIVKPVAGQEFDADVLLVLARQWAWRRQPSRYVDAVHDALKSSAVYRHRVTMKSRCVRVRYANDCHVDVVPFLEGDWLYGSTIVNGPEETFEACDPRAFSTWLQRKDDLANGNLRKVIRLMKHLRDSDDEIEVPSVILTVLAGRCVSGGLALLGRYDDLPGTLRTVLGSLDTRLRSHPSLPVIRDPARTGTTFQHRWNERQYSKFREWVHASAEVAKAAHREPTVDASLSRWRQILGEEFGRGPR